MTEQQTGKYLSNIDRNVKISPLLTALASAALTLVGTSFMLGRKVEEFQGRIVALEKQTEVQSARVTRIEAQQSVNTADLRSLKDWRAEFLKK